MANFAKKLFDYIASACFAVTVFHSHLFRNPIDSELAMTQPQSQTQPTAMFISKDVFFWPVVKAAATEVGCPLVIGSKPTDAKFESLVADDVRCCMVDLAAIELADLPNLVASLREKFRQLCLVGFASHVHEARLVAAHDAGFDQVLSRGQFSSQVADHLRRWLGMGT